jgi:hypothetical protein
MSDAPWKVRQYCYFWTASPVVPAAEVSEALGMPADRLSVRGSRRSTPAPVPVEHAWEVHCERHGRIDEQCSEILRRIEPVADKVRVLVDRGDVQAGLMLVRYFYDEDGGYDAMSWGLSSEQVALLSRMGAGLQADEYAGDFTVHGPST